MRGLAKEVEKIEKENTKLRKVLTTLVRRYVANPSTSSQFVSCITPGGNMPEWDDAMRALGLPLHPKRGYRRHE